MSALREAVAAYWRAEAPDGQRAALGAALSGAGYVLEGELLAAHGWCDAGGQWAGRTIWVGRRPPADAEAGQLWLDTVELMPMIAGAPERGQRPPWLALRPVARWQLRAFAQVAPLVSHQLQVDPPVRFFDPERLARGRDDAPITEVTPGEAALYAEWFGKYPAGQNHWRAVAAASIDVSRLWAGLHEWSSEHCQGDDALRVRLSADSWQKDWDLEEYAAEMRGVEFDDDTRMLLGPLAMRPDTGFRTAVSGRTGLLARPHASLDQTVPLAFLRLFPR